MYLNQAGINDNDTDNEKFIETYGSIKQFSIIHSWIITFIVMEITLGHTYRWHATTEKNPKKDHTYRWHATTEKKKTIHIAGMQLPQKKPRKDHTYRWHATSKQYTVVIDLYTHK